MRRIITICASIIILLTGEALAQVNTEQMGLLKGTTFGDFYWIPSSHNPDLEGNNGFWIRRIYLTYDREISESFSSRLRLEMNSEGDFISNTKMTPVVKDAYLKWNNDRHAMYAGISSTPTWSLVEDLWSYRSVEKTPLDLQKLGSSRDFGISLKGNLDDEKEIGYHFMIGNGNSNGPELNKGKKVMVSFNYKLTDHFIAEVYGDYNRETENINSYTLQSFLGYKDQRMSAGILYALKVEDNNMITGDEQYRIISLFSHFRTSDKTNVLFRVDHMFDPNPDGSSIDYIPFSNDANSTLIIGGVDVELEENIHLIPNVESVFYGQGESGDKPDADLTVKLTLSYSF